MALDFFFFKWLATYPVLSHLFSMDLERSPTVVLEVIGCLEYFRIIESISESCKKFRS